MAPEWTHRVRYAVVLRTRRMLVDTTYQTLIPLFEELNGEHVLVRPYRAEDAEDLRTAVEESREHLRPWLPFADLHQTVEETRDWILRGVAKRILREEIPGGIWERQSGRFLGGLGLHPRNWYTGYFEVGYWVRPSAEGHGYVSEAVRLVTDYLFAHLEATRVEIRCNALNTRSANVARRLGFVQEGYLRHHMRAPDDGEVRDTLVFARIPSDPR
jgi:RimJ/RimL family protein N-acetyltransferase